MKRQVRHDYKTKDTTQKGTTMTRHATPDGQYHPAYIHTASIHTAYPHPTRPVRFQTRFPHHTLLSHLSPRVHHSVQIITLGGVIMRSYHRTASLVFHPTAFLHEPSVGRCCTPSRGCMHSSWTKTRQTRREIVTEQPDVAVLAPRGQSGWTAWGWWNAWMLR
jgi:hypothetical protein